MNLDPAIDMIRAFEGFRAKPYLCPAGKATIGYGSTWRLDGSPVELTDPPMSEAQAVSLLEREVYGTALPGVLRLCPLTISQPGVLNALVDFTFNLGVGQLQTSTLRRKINAQDWQGAREQLARWIRGGGRVLPGLVRRRAAEAALLPP
jgi:lysozyme